MNYGEKIAAARKNMNLSQSELARRVGVSSQMICCIESGKRLPGMKVALDLCHELNISIDETFNEKGA